MEAFSLFWKRLNDAKPITSDVRMTPQQFQNMLRQAYNAGYKDGEKSNPLANMLNNPIFGGR